MSKSYQTSFDNARSPMSPSSGSSTLTPGLNFKTNINRIKSRRWVDAPKVDYGGGWGDDDEYDYDDEPQSTTSARSSVPATSPPSALLRRQDSFDRGDDGLSPVEPQGRSDWNLPPTPAELEQRERELRQTPTTQISVPVINVPTSGHSSPARAHPPQQRTQQVQSPSASPPVSPPLGSNGGSSFSIGMRERVPPPLDQGLSVRPSVSKSSYGDKPLPLPKDPEPQQPPKFTSLEPPSASVQPQGGADVSRKHPIRKSSIDKPTPPLPPPEDTSLETILEHSNSGPSSPGFSPTPVSSIASPGVNTGTGPERAQKQPHVQQESPEPQQQQPSPKPIRPTISPPPSRPVHQSGPAPSSPSSPVPRIIRPSDIYKRHQEEMRRRASEESSRPSVDSISRPSIDSQRSGTEQGRPRQLSAASDTLPQIRGADRIDDLRQSSAPTSRSSSRQGREPGRPTSRGESSRARSASANHSSPNPYLPPVITLPPVPGSPLVPENFVGNNLRDSSWGDDILAGYADPPEQPKKVGILATGDKADSPSVPPAISGADELVSPTTDLRDMVDGAFKRQDTLMPTPDSDARQSGADLISPILPQQGPGGEHLNGSLETSFVPGALPAGMDNISVSRNGESGASLSPPKHESPPPEKPREVVRRQSSPIIVTTPASEGIAVIDEVTPVSATPHQPTSPPDELPVITGESKVANRPTTNRPATPKTGPVGAVPGPAKQDITPTKILAVHSVGTAAPSQPVLTAQPMLPTQLAPPRDNNPRESMGIFSIYDSYWSAADEEEVVPPPPPPPPIQPKSPLRSSPQLQHRNIESSLPSSKKPDVPPVTVPEEARRGGEPETPASVPETPDSELMDMFAVGNKYLNRRDTVYSVAPRGGREESAPPVPKLPEGKVVGLDAEGLQVIPPPGPLGPESEGIEAVGGPTIQSKSPVDDDKTPVENEYTKELISQFRRPQTLMLKDTMPMPSGTQVLPPMPPMPGSGEKAPEAVNFDSEDVDEKECLLDEIAGKEVIQSEQPGLEPLSADKDSEVMRPESHPAIPPPPPEKEIVSERPQTAHTTHSGRRPPVFQDMKAIQSLSNSGERTKAYNDLRQYIIEQPTGLEEWAEYQMNHNSGQALLDAQIVDIKENTGLKKTKSKIALPSTPVGAGDEGHPHGHQGHRSERLERFGKGALKVGEKAGGKVGGWMKRVKKGHKESAGGNDTGVYQKQGVAPSMVSLASSNASPEHGRTGSAGTITPVVSHSRPSTAHQQTPSTPHPPVPQLPQLPQLQNQAPLTMPSQQSSQSPPQAEEKPPDEPPQPALHVQTQFEKPPTSVAQPQNISASSGDTTRQSTPNQYYRTGAENTKNISGITMLQSESSREDNSETSVPVPVPVPVQSSQFPKRNDSLHNSVAGLPSSRDMSSPTTGSPFPQRGDSLQQRSSQGLVPEPPTSDDTVAEPEAVTSPVGPPPPQQHRHQYSEPFPQQYPQQHPQQHPQLHPQMYQHQFMHQSRFYGPPRPQLMVRDGKFVLQHPSTSFPDAPAPSSHAPSLSQQLPMQVQGLTGQPPVGPPQEQQPQPQRYSESPSPSSYSGQPPSPTVRRNSSSFIKAFAGIGSKRSSSGAQASPSSPSSAEQAGKEKPKRSSFLSSLGKKVERSSSVASQHPHQAEEPPKMQKRGSLLTRLGQQQEKLLKKDKLEAGKSHKKGRSMDMFGPSASSVERFTKAATMGGRTSGASHLAQSHDQSQSKDYNPATGQHLNYDPAQGRSPGQPGYPYQGPLMQGQPYRQPLPQHEMRSQGSYLAQQGQPPVQGNPPHSPPPQSPGPHAPRSSEPHASQSPGPHAPQSPGPHTPQSSETPLPPGHVQQPSGGHPSPTNVHGQSDHGVFHPMQSIHQAISAFPPLRPGTSPPASSPPTGHPGYLPQRSISQTSQGMPLSGHQPQPTRYQSPQTAPQIPQSRSPPSGSHTPSANTPVPPPLSGAAPQPSLYEPPSPPPHSSVFVQNSPIAQLQSMVGNNVSSGPSQQPSAPFSQNPSLPAQGPASQQRSVRSGQSQRSASTPSPQLSRQHMDASQSPQHSEQNLSNESSRREASSPTGQRSVSSPNHYIRTSTASPPPSLPPLPQYNPPPSPPPQSQSPHLSRHSSAAESSQSLRSPVVQPSNLEAHLEPTVQRPQSPPRGSSSNQYHSSPNRVIGSGRTTNTPDAPPASASTAPVTISLVAPPRPPTPDDDVSSPTSPQTPRTIIAEPDTSPLQSTPRATAPRAKEETFFDDSSSSEQNSGAEEGNLKIKTGNLKDVDSDPEEQYQMSATSGPGGGWEYYGWN